VRSSLHPVYYCAASFLLLAPLSVATGSSLCEPAKYARVATTLLMVGTWAAASRCQRLGPAGWGMVSFVALFVASSLWSDLPHWALFHKGMFALTCLSGIGVVAVCRSREQFQKGMQLLGIVSLFAAIVSVLVFRMDPTSANANSRLALMGMNANGVGHTAAALIIPCTYLICHSQRLLLRLLSLIACVILGAIAFGSGSRGALLFGFCGLIMIAAPRFRRSPGLVLVLSVAILLGAVVYDYVGIQGGQRLSDNLTKDTRSGIWVFAIRQFLDSPVIGQGWLHRGNGWATFQNAYLQVLAETGIVGFALLAYAIALIVGAVMKGRRTLRHHGMPPELVQFSAALIGANLLHGMFETSIVTGGSVGTFLLGIGIGLADWAVPLTLATSRPTSRASIVWTPLQPPAVGNAASSTPTPCVSSNR